MRVVTKKSPLNFLNPLPFFFVSKFPQLVLFTSQMGFPAGVHRWKPQNISCMAFKIRI